MRCLALAKTYKNINITFACENLEGNLNYKVTEEGFDLEILRNNSKELLEELIKRLYIDYLVIDSYDIDFEFEKSIKKQCDIKLLCFDDTYKQHYCDIVLNHNIYANANRYINLVPSFCEIRCGYKYTILREEFKKYRYLKRENRILKKVMISFGGSDFNNITLKVLNVLKKIKDLEIFVVTTSSNTNIESLEKFGKINKSIKILKDIDYISRVMKKVDMAVVSASSILHESIFMKLPFIAVMTADNQKFMKKYLISRKLPILDSDFRDKKFLNEFNKVRLKGKICRIS